MLWGGKERREHAEITAVIITFSGQSALSEEEKGGVND